MSDLGRRAGLSPEQLRPAVDWNTRRTSPRDTLPGGQWLPNGHTPASVTRNV